jgi:hypothetical protein
MNYKAAIESLKFRRGRYQVKLANLKHPLTFYQNKETEILIVTHDIDVCNLAIQALEEREEYKKDHEKQVVKRWNIASIEEDSGMIANCYTCPACGIIYSWGRKATKYCDNCGQRLEVSDG